MSKSNVYLVSAKKTPSDVQYHSGYDNVVIDGSNYDDEAPNRRETDVNNPFYGMNKEELLQHSGKPFWRFLRGTCIGIVLLAWLALLVTVVALVLLYPKCKAAEPRSWWQKEVMYRVYVRSFRDSDGNGIGDLKGVESQLDHLNKLGAKAISLSAVYQTDNKESDQGVTDHKMIKSEYGSMDDFKSLLKAIHDKGMYLIMDFIPNHTSDLHPWFVKSQNASTQDNYRNYYVWTQTTNNWTTMNGSSSAWTSGASHRSSEYYLHQADSSSLPDLNLRSTLVQQELEKIMQFWLEAGVDGFYIRDSGFLFEDYDMRSNPSAMERNYTYGLPEINDMFARWRSLLSSFSNTERIILADINGDPKDVMKYYGYFQRDGAHLSLNQQFFDDTGSCNGACIKTYVDSWLNNLPSGRWANWMGGDENTKRIASRFNTNFLPAFTMLTMLLPGTPIIYYGDEIGMKDVTLTPSTDYRKQPMRSLMQWDNSSYGGFQNSSCANCQPPWIREGDYTTNNVKEQTANKDSYLNYIRDMITFRKKTSFQAGEYHTAVVDSSVFSFVREFNGENGYLVAINFGDTKQTRNYYGSYSTIEMDVTVDMTTGKGSSFAIGDEVKTDSIELGPNEGVVVSWAYVAKEEL